MMRARLLPFLSSAICALNLGCGEDSASDTHASGGAAGTSGASDSAAEVSGGEAGTTSGAMSFFVTSRGSGTQGGDYGGLEGADALCQSLAEGVGAAQRVWRAYLCTSTVHARDRIGSGPWRNQRGDLIATDVESLHTNGIQKEPTNLIVDENGESVPLAEHDIVTGCNQDGTLAPNLTCDDWTSNSDQLAARVGHSDIPPPPFDMSISWNSVHPSSSCTEMGLAERLGSGRIYCFAADAP